MKNKFTFCFALILILSGCVGVSSTGIFGTGVSVALDPRSVGTQIDDSIMQKNLAARILVKDKKYLISAITSQPIITDKEFLSQAKNSRNVLLKKKYWFLLKSLIECGFETMMRISWDCLEAFRFPLHGLTHYFIDIRY